MIVPLVLVVFVSSFWWQAELFFAQYSLWQLISDLVPRALVVIACLSFVCSWHRTVLLGEGSPRTGFGLFFRRPELHYLMNIAIIVMLVIFIDVALRALTAPFATVLFPTVFMSTVVLKFGDILVLTFLWARFFPAFPAAAIGGENIDFTKAWWLTKPNWATLFFAFLPALIIVFGVNIWLEFLALRMEELGVSHGFSLLAGEGAVPDIEFSITEPSLWNWIQTYVPWQDIAEMAFLSVIVFVPLAFHASLMSVAYRGIMAKKEVGLRE
jgi:hypothetical protein